MKITRLFLLAMLLVVLSGCSGGGGDATPSLSNNCGASTSTSVTISGTITYDRVPHLTTSSGLNYSATSAYPARGVTVQALNAANSVIATTTTNANGTYTLQVPGNTSITVRTLAQMQLSGTPSWDIRVVDNTAGNAQWAMSGTAFCTTTTNITNKNYHAASGWNGSSYASPRVAAPFAILDTVYAGITMILGANPNAAFPPLTLNWSPNNTLTTISTSYFTTIGGLRHIFILGGADEDTDEFDAHVIAHEFGHYYEDAFSRSDSLGGPHSEANRLDLTVAFGEGFGNAFSAMVMQNPIYKDSTGAGQGTGFSINVENNSNTNPGWFSEGSVQSILYDLFDSTADTNDTVALDFAPLHTVLVSSQRNTPALTSIFSFITALKANYAADTTTTNGINAIVNAQSIVSNTIDAFGTTETNNGGITNGTIPVYLTLSSGNTISNVCTTDANGGYNRLGASRYLNITPSTSGSRTITVTGGANSDFDMVLIQSGTILLVNENPGTSETLAYNYTANVTYVLAVYDFNLLVSTTYNGQSCFTVSMN